MSQPTSLRILIVSSLLLVPLSAPSAVSASPSGNIKPSPISNLQSPDSALSTQHSALLFVPNHSQWPDPVRFQMRTGNQTWWFTDEAVWVTVMQGTEGTQGTQRTQGTAAGLPDHLVTLSSSSVPQFLSSPSPCLLVSLSPCLPVPLSGVNLRLTFPNLSPTARLIPLDPVPTRHNYFQGNDTAKWRSNVPTFGALRWEGVAPGVDVEFGPTITVNGDASALRLRVEGADGLGLNRKGQLVTQTAIGSVPLPFAVSGEIDGNLVALRSGAMSDGPGEQGQALLGGGHPDTDPGDLIYSTFLGAGSQLGNTGYENIGDVALGPDGLAIVAGSTTSPDFPTTPGAFDTTYGDSGQQQAFVTKFSADGSSLVYSTFLGGRGYETEMRIAALADGSVIVVGTTLANNFPVTPDAYDTTANGMEDIFITRLNAEGSDLVYSTYLGSPQKDFVYGVAVRTDGAAYVTGKTRSTNFPVTPNAFDRDFNGGTNDSFVTALSPDGSQLIFSTYLGGSAIDVGDAIALDPSGNVTVAGQTLSPDFPTTPGAFDVECGGCTRYDDGFVTKLQPDGSALVYSTYLGGASSDQAYGLTMNDHGVAFLTGRTWSADFPVTPGAYDTACDPCPDDQAAFITALSPDGSNLVWSTFLGGDQCTVQYYCVEGKDIALGPGGQVAVVGYTTDRAFPVLARAYDSTFNGEMDIFVSKFSPDGATLLYSTFLGGNDGECSYRCGIEIAADGTAFVASDTNSGDFPITPGAFQTTCEGCTWYSDVIVSHLNLDPTCQEPVADPGPGFQPEASADSSGPAPARPGNWLFVPNIGQFDPQVRYQAQMNGATWWFTDEAVWVTVTTDKETRRQGDKETEFSPIASSYNENGNGGRMVSLSPKGVHLKLTFPGLSPAAQFIPADEQPARINYFLGPDATKWRSNVPTYAAMRWESIMPGLNLIFGGEQWTVESDLSGFGNPTGLSVHVEGANSLNLDDDGHVMAQTAIGPVSLPVEATKLDGNTATLSSLKSPNLQSPISNLLRQDTRPAAGSPTGERGESPPDLMLYSTFLGGSSDDYANGIAVGADGSAYVTGQTLSSTFPTTPGAFDRTLNGGEDVFVTRLAPDGRSVLYSTYLGGSGDDIGYDIAVDVDGLATVSGETASSDFPVTPGAYDSTHNGSSDGFVTRLSPAGDQLVFSTFLGGAGAEELIGIALKSDGAPVVTGETESGDFPTTVGAFDTSYNGETDVVVTQLNPTGSGLVYSTFLGGADRDEGDDATLDQAGAAYLTGLTLSTDYPATAGAFDTTFNGEYDVYVSKLSPDGAALVYSTFLGSRGIDFGRGIAVGADGAAYITGDSWASGFPTTPGAYDTSYNGGGDKGGGDVFVTKLDPSGASLVYSTYIGGTDEDDADAMSIGPDGTAILTGLSVSRDYPTTPDALDRSLFSSDAIITRLNVTGSALVYSTFLGGSSSNGEGATDLAVDPAGLVYLTGWTPSRDFPVSPDAYDISYNGGTFDAFVTKVNPIAQTISVAGIDLGYRPAGQRNQIFASVRIQDQNGEPVPGALVSLLVQVDCLEFNLTATTGDHGRATVAGYTALHGQFVFTVTGVSKFGWLYKPEANVETSDSITIP